MPRGIYRRRKRSRARKNSFTQREIESRRQTALYNRAMRVAATALLEAAAIASPRRVVQALSPIV